MATSYRERPGPKDDTPLERMKFYLREVGQGKTGYRDLTQDEACDAMSLVLSGEATQAQAGAFLLLNRMKGETPEELVGFAEAARAVATRIKPNVSGLLDIGSPYDGRKKSIVVSPASAVVVAAAGVPVVMHGERDLGPKHGVPIGDVLTELGIETDSEPEDVQRAIEAHGLGYMRQERFVPAMFALKSLREEIALRSPLHTVEKIYNLAGAEYCIIGLAHFPYMEKMLEASSKMGFKRVLIVQGIEGNEDAPTSRACRAFLWDRGERLELRIDAADYDLAAASKEEMEGGDALFNAGVAERILDGEAGGHRDLVLMNAGIRIWLAERAPTIGDGIVMARQAIDSGAAKAKLSELRGGSP